MFTNDKVLTYLSHNKFLYIPVYKSNLGLWEFPNSDSCLCCTGESPIK